MPWIRLALFAVLTAVNVGLLAKYVLDNRFLYAWSLQYVAEDDLPSEKVVALAEAFRILRNTEESGLRQVQETQRVVGAFGPLSLTPREVVEHGGPCESKSRLMRTLLHLHGIASRRVLLKEKASHTVTEVEIEDGKRMLVDPLYGLYFPKPEGGYYASAELAQDPEIMPARVAEVLADPGSGPAAYHSSTTRYVGSISYANPRISIQWRRDSFLRAKAYDALSLVAGEDWIKSTSRPYLMERPVLMVLVATGGLQVAAALTLIPALMRRRSVT